MNEINIVLAQDSNKICKQIKALKAILPYDDEKSKAIHLQAIKELESTLENLTTIAESFMNEHKKAWREWKHGNIKDVWKDEFDRVCVKYESGEWWHYKVENNGDVVWW